MATSDPSSPSGQTLFLVDGTYTVFRSFFAVSGLRAPDGTPTGGVFGFVNSMRKLLEEHAPEHVAVAFDLEGPTHRDEIYDEYKANRPPPPEDLVPQFPLAHESSEALGWPVVTAAGYEADDVIATLAAKAREKGLRVVVVTSDKDLYQLVDGEVSVLNLSKGRLLDSDGVDEVFGVRPEGVVDVLALMGDAVDNVPGVPGVGEKTAKSLVRRYGGIDVIRERAAAFARAFSVRDALLEVLGDEDAELPAGDLGELAASVRKVAAIERGLDEVEEELVSRLDALAATAEGGEPDKKVLKRQLKDLARKTQPKVWCSIFDNEEILALSHTLVTVHRDVPVDLDLEAMRVGAPDHERAAALFQRLGFRRLTEEMRAGASAPAAPEVGEETKEGKAASRERLFETVLVRTDAELASAVEALSKGGDVAFDTETDGLDPRRCRLVGLALCASEERGYYIPVGHAGEDSQLAWGVVRDAVSGLLGDESRRKIAQNYKFDRAVLRHAGLVVEGPIFDTLIASQLLDPARSASHKLDHLAQRYLGIEMIPYEAVAKKDGGEVTLDLIDAETVAEYAVEDAVVTFRLAAPLRSALAERDLDDLYEEIEGPLVGILEEMQDAGIGVDVALLEKMSSELGTRLAELEREIWDLAGHEFNVNSPAQLRTVLFDELGLEPTGRRTQKTKKHSTGQETLEALADRHPLPSKVLEFRELSKLKSTYLDAMPRLVAADDGRIHGQFHQIGAATGRLSSSDPNLQNIPIRTELGREIRKAFVPAPGHLFIGADYSQMELRLLAHLADDPALIEAFKLGHDIHRYTASLVTGVPLEEVTPEMRGQAKAVNFGIIYGMSEYRLAREQTMTIEEARGFIASYFARYPAVRRYIDEVERQVQETGEVRTLYGRVRDFPELAAAASGTGRRLSKPAREQLLRQAVNATVQGTAADLVKRAMISIRCRLSADRLPARLVLQVHDELLFEVPEDEAERAAEAIVDEMKRAGALSVPLEVDASVGPTWAAVH